MKTQRVGFSIPPLPRGPFVEVGISGISENGPELPELGFWARPVKGGKIEEAEGESANTTPRTESSSFDQRAHHCLEGHTAERLCKNVREVLVSSNTLRSDHLQVSQLASKVAADANVLVGLMIHRIEDKRDDT